ncbi:hypothetical protein ACU8KH_03749 [Lachancea thermotolerans]
MLLIAKTSNHGTEQFAAPGPFSHVIKGLMSLSTKVKSLKILVLALVKIDGL